MQRRWQGRSTKSRLPAVREDRDVEAILDGSSDDAADLRKELPVGSVATQEHVLTVVDDQAAAHKRACGAAKPWPGFNERDR